MSTHNLCFRAKISKNVYPYNPQFYYIKVGCKGVFVTRTCFRDGLLWPRGDKTFFMINSAELEIYPAHKC